MSEIVLPHVLSELAQMALDDVRKVERRSGFTINMGTWASSMSDSCVVCAAGSVMVERLGFLAGDSIKYNEEIVGRFGVHNAAALLAIDALRKGCVGAALQILGNGDPVTAWYDDDLDPDCDDHKLSREIPDYGGPGWLDGMERLVTDLREAGL